MLDFCCFYGNLLFVGNPNWSIRDFDYLFIVIAVIVLPLALFLVFVSDVGNRKPVDVSVAEVVGVLNGGNVVGVDVVGDLVLVETGDGRKGQTVIGDGELAWFLSQVVGAGVPLSVTSDGDDKMSVAGVVWLSVMVFVGAGLVFGLMVSWRPVRRWL